MFRKKYKEANRHIESRAAYERVQKMLEEAKPHRRNWQQITTIAACVLVAAVGISAYEIKTKSGEIVPEFEPQMTRMTDIENIEIALGEPLFDMSTADVGEFENILKDDSYRKRTVNGVDVFEKDTGEEYECWIEMDGKITKITANSITDKEKDEIIHSVLQ